VSDYELSTKQLTQHLVRLAPHFGLLLTDSLLEKLSLHYQLLLKWNQKVNLIAIGAPAEVAQFHYLESLFGAKAIAPGIRTLIDVGSGAGFPGLPLALARADLWVTLIESKRKKAVFLMEAVRQLGLSNAAVFNGRFEDYEERDFEALTCRALDRMGSQIPKLMVKGGKHCRQLIFFCSSKLASQIEKQTLPPWSPDRIPIPLSKDRFLVLLRR